MAKEYGNRRETYTVANAVYAGSLGVEKLKSA